MSINHAVGDYLVRSNDLYKDIVHSNSSVNDKVAVFIDGRDTFWNDKVIRMAMMHLGSTWNLRIYETPIAVKTHDRVFSSWNISRVMIPMQNVTRDMYSCLLKTPEFWKGIPEEHILIFQTDSLILGPVPDDALEWDIMGAPCGKDNLVMNGGTTLRRRSAMIDVLERYPEEFTVNPEEPEDITFSRAMRADPRYKVPSVEQNERYFFESKWPASTDVFAVHGTTKTWVTSEQYRQVLKKSRY